MFEKMNKSIIVGYRADCSTREFEYFFEIDDVY